MRSYNKIKGYMNIISQLVKGSIDSSRMAQISDLDEYCFQHILQYLPLRDLFNYRSVNKFFMRNIDQHLESIRYLTYNTSLNGVKMYNGEYVFNGKVFDFILSKMPNIRIIEFENCPEMFGALATTNYNIIKSMADHLIMLNELYITRCRALDKSSFELLVDSFPNLTHLMTTIYNETTIQIITKGFPNLKYFNLDKSVINDYGPHLEHLGYKITSFIASPDYYNHKYSIIDGLISGNGKYLKELELKIKVSDSDHRFFELIGEEFPELIKFKCVFDSKRINNDYPIITGLKRLTSLKSLHLEENTIYNQFHTIFDDWSLIDIMKNCIQLEELTIITGKHDNTYSNFITDTSLSLIDELLPNIRKLSLKSVDITDQTLDSIERLNKLDYLRLDSIFMVSNNGIENFITNCYNINRVEIHNCTQFQI